MHTSEVTTASANAVGGHTNKDKHHVALSFSTVLNQRCRLQLPIPPPTYIDGQKREVSAVKASREVFSFSSPKPDSVIQLISPIMHMLIMHRLDRGWALHALTRTVTFSFCRNLRIGSVPTLCTMSISTVAVHPAIRLRLPTSFRPSLCLMFTVREFESACSYQNVGEPKPLTGGEFSTRRLCGEAIAISRTYAHAPSGFNIQ